MSWTKKAVPTASATFETPPIGSHGAILVAIIDLGTHEEAFQGEASRANHKVFLCWELTSLQLSGTTNNHLIGRSFTYSFHEKAALSKIIKSWGGKALAAGATFDLLTLLGKKCMISISHKESGDKVYAALDGVSAVPKGMEVSPAKRKPVERYVLSDQPVPDWLPYLYGEKLEEVIQRSEEVRGANQTDQAEAVAVAEDDGDNPFSY